MLSILPYEGVSDLRRVDGSLQRKMLMRIEYNNLRKLLIDKIMKKKDINNAESINSNTIAKFGRKEEDLFETFAK